MIWYDITHPCLNLFSDFHGERNPPTLAAERSKTEGAPWVTATSSTSTRTGGSYLNELLKNLLNLHIHMTFGSVLEHFLALVKPWTLPENYKNKENPSPAKHLHLTTVLPTHLWNSISFNKVSAGWPKPKSICRIFQKFWKANDQTETLWYCGNIGRKPRSLREPLTITEQSLFSEVPEASSHPSDPAGSAFSHRLGL